MERSRTDLARAIDALANAGRATVTESRTELALYQLGAADARDIVALLVRGDDLRLRDSQLL